MNHLKIAILMLLLSPWIVGASSGCPNAFREAAQTDTDPAIFFDAQMQINIPDYNQALATLARASSRGLGTRNGHVLRASAYAGRCGLDMADLSTKFGGLSTITLYNLLINVYKATPTASTAPADCYSAETELMAIPAASGTTDDYTFLAFDELTKIGTTIAKYADTDDDGVVDPSYNACSTIPDADVRQLGTGLTLLVAGLQRSGYTFSLSAQLTTLCTRLVALSGNVNFCTVTTPAGFSATDVKAIRSMTLGNEIGFATCGGTTGSAGCSCP